jgi:hypothetical protein
MWCVTLNATYTDNFKCSKYVSSWKPEGKRPFSRLA